MHAFRNGWKSSSASAPRAARRTRAIPSRCARSSRCAWRGPSSKRQLDADDPRAAPRADRAGDRGDRSPHGRDECRERLTPFTGTTTAPSTTSTASPGRSGISTGRRSRVRSGASRARRRTPISPRARTPAERARERRRPASALARAVGLEAVPGLALVAPRQPVERQPPPDRGLRRLRVARRFARRVSTTRPIVTRSSSAARSTPTPGARRDGRRRYAARRADVDSLARSLEVRRARVPLLPARSRARDRRGRFAASARRLAARRFCRPGRSARSRRSPASIATRTSSRPSARSRAACWRSTRGPVPLPSRRR